MLLTDLSVHCIVNNTWGELLACKRVLSLPCNVEDNLKITINSHIYIFTLDSRQSGWAHSSLNCYCYIAINIPMTSTHEYQIK